MKKCAFWEYFNIISVESMNSKDEWMVKICFLVLNKAPCSAGLWEVDCYYGKYEY